MAESGLDAEPAHAHGMLCALLSVRPQGAIARWREELALAAGTAAPSPRASSVLDRLAAATRASLGAEDLGRAVEFTPMLPGDEAPLAERGRALGQWCSGFLYGLALAGAGEPADLPGDAPEVVSDLVELARLDRARDVADEESERAYFELVEYVRVGVMTVYSELARARAGSGGDDAPQTEE
ncbi:MAG: UPF0149 family protein [Ectothiorhodospiraceae bacterium]|nr:UPF0149 family protein [Chromatiales bacterium]MCP5156768.1 UPF0149 family protein [Ectothiorhodospiraceae bacterium]